VPEFFDEHFPGVTDLIPSAPLIESFIANPHLPLISIKCQPHHCSHSGVIVGDAAHAMVPFFGQGMNAGLEDVRILFSYLDRHLGSVLDNITPVNNPELLAIKRAEALNEYSRSRTPDAAAINDLALQNYAEMRASVISPVYKIRKYLEETLTIYVPSLGWRTKYSRVSFGNERYSEVVKKSQRQGKLLVGGLIVGLTSPMVIGFLAVLWWRRGRGDGVSRWLLKFQD
jgi:kynurenine 3-monooxygenase